MRKWLVLLLLLLIGCSKKSNVIEGSLIDMNTLEYDGGSITFDYYKDNRFIKMEGDTKLEALQEEVDNITKISSDIMPYITDDSGKRVPRSTRYMTEFNTGTREKAYYFNTELDDNSNATKMVLLVNKGRKNKQDKFFIVIASNENGLESQTVYSMYNFIKDAKSLSYDYIKYTNCKILNTSNVVINRAIFEGDLWAIGNSDILQASSGYIIESLDGTNVLKYKDGFDINSIVNR